MKPSLDPRAVEKLRATLAEVMTEEEAAAFETERDLTVRRLERRRCAELLAIWAEEAWDDGELDTCAALRETSSRLAGTDPADDDREDGQGVAATVTVSAAPGDWTSLPRSGSYAARFDPLPRQVWISNMTWRWRWPLRIERGQWHHTTNAVGETIERRWVPEDASHA